jgi:proteasome-associated ATPase
MASSEGSRTQQILDKIEEHAPKDNARLQNYLSALREAIERETEDHAKSEELLKEYSEAYEKLTAPANRTGVFLRWLEDKNAPDKLAVIAVGDTEYVVLVDPVMKDQSFVMGDRVRVNEAYAIIGRMPAIESGPLYRVADVLEDGRLRLGSETPGGDSRFILRSPGLTDTQIRTGDEVRVDTTGRIAVEHFPKTESKDYFLESVPEIEWDQVGGQHDAIKLIRDTIEQPLLYPEIFAKYEKKPIKGILLYGPPGCGKTLLGKATAHNLAKEYSKRVGHEVKEYFMAISGPKILNMWLGETERMVREIFRTAREKAKEGRLVFIFMDEAEAVLRTRSSGRYLNISNTVVPQFCAELDGLQSLENVVLMLTSNRPDYIDPAILRPERIDRKVKINRPDRDAAQQILGIYLHSRIPLDPKVVAKYDGEVDCARKELIEATVDFIWSKSKQNEFLKVFLRNGSSDTLYFKDMISGALLKSIVDRAKDSAIKRAIADLSGETGIELDDLIQATSQEFKENEIFPRSDSQEDWLQLLDYAAENVASVKPIGRNRGEEFARKTVI